MTDTGIGRLELAVTAVTEAWRRVLDLATPPIDQDFFDSGGNSLSAMRIASTLKAQGWPVQFTDIYEHPTIVALAEALSRRDPVAADEAGLSFATPSAGPDTTRWDVSHLQEERLILEEKALRTGAAIPRDLVSGAFRLDQPVDHEVLMRSLHAVVHRHDALRSRFDKDAQGWGWTVAPECTVPLCRLSVTQAGLDAELRALMEEPFDVGAAPLMRVGLYDLDDGDQVLAVVLHHMVCDGWSFALLLGQWAEAYDVLRHGGDLASQDAWPSYRIFASTERALLHGDELRCRLAFWRGVFSNAVLPGLTVRNAPQRPDAPSFSGDSVSMRLDDDVARRLCQAERAWRTSAAVIGLACVHEVMREWLLDNPLPAVYVADANRDGEALQQVIGCLFDAIPMVPDDHLPSRPALAAQDLQSALARAREYRLPMALLAKSLQPEQYAPLNMNPFLFYNPLDMSTLPALALHFGGARARSLPMPNPTAFPGLTFTFYRDGQRNVDLSLDFERDWLPRSLAAAVLDSWHAALRRALQDLSAHDAAVADDKRG